MYVRHASRVCHGAASQGTKAGDLVGWRAGASSGTAGLPPAYPPPLDQPYHPEEYRCVLHAHR